MKTTSMTIAAGLSLALASRSQAQLGGYPLSYTLGYSTFTGCNVGPAMITLPGGAVYYVPGTAPTGGVGVGVCWFGPTGGTGTVNVPTGWVGLGYSPPPPPNYFGNEDESSANNNEENNASFPNELPPANTHLVNSTETQNPPGGGAAGGGNDGPQFTTTEIATTTTPEPASLILVGSGLAGLAGLGWRRRKR